LQSSSKSYTILLEKGDNANISRFDALLAAGLYADHGHPGSFVSTAAKADASGLCFMGFGCDIDPHDRSLYRDLDKTGQAANSISVSTNRVGFENLSARNHQENCRRVKDEMKTRSLSSCTIGVL
jgi:hypothetical protein